MYFECILSQLLSKKMTACLDFFYPSTSLIKITTPFPQVQNFQPSIPNSFQYFSVSDTFFEKSSPIFPFTSTNLYSYFFNICDLFSCFKFPIYGADYSTGLLLIPCAFVETAEVISRQYFSQKRLYRVPLDFLRVPMLYLQTV